MIVLQNAEELGPNLLFQRVLGQGQELPGNLAILEVDGLHRPRGSAWMCNGSGKGRPVNAARL